MDIKVETVQDLIHLIEFERREADRKREMVQRTAQSMGQKITPAEIERVGHENDKLAAAYYMILNSITAGIREKAIPGKAIGAAKPLVEMKIVGPDKLPIPLPTSTAPVTPVLSTIEAKKEAEEIITAVEVEDSIYEAARLADFKQNNEHWDIARSKVEHFYQGSDELGVKYGQSTVDNLIKDICKRVSDRNRKRFEDEIGLERATAVPVTSPDEIQRVQFVKNGKFNIAVLLGKGHTGKTPAENEDRVKITAIQLFTRGEESQAVQLLRAFYKSKEWSEITAREFLFTLMNKDPHKELKMVVKGILAHNKKQKGDPLKGVSMCRNIVAAYFGKYYKTTVKDEKLSLEQENINKRVDRIINRELKDITT